MNRPSDEFYIGYLPGAPPRLARFLRVTIVGLIGAVAGMALIAVFGQPSFPKSTFEYQSYRTYRGVVSAHPYPTLTTAEGQYLLVLPGKHGAGQFGRAYAGLGVELKAARIERSGETMLELLPDSDRRVGRPFDQPRAADKGEIVLTGEIVDSKCYLGVMNPGNGKVHRDCAARCISGGIPPAFIATDAAGENAFMLLAGPHGEPLQREVLDFVAERVQARGTLARFGKTLVLRADPALFHRIRE